MADFATGGCTCGKTRYSIKRKPLIVHCCHCSHCQRQTGSAFVVNVLVEQDQVILTEGEVQDVDFPTPSGAGQTARQCTACNNTLWSTYRMPNVAFVRGGTLDAPNLAPPDVHIYTVSKCDWVTLPDRARIFDKFYDPKTEWSDESRARFRAVRNN